MINSVETNMMFPWDGNSDVNKIYQQDNFQILKTKAKNKKAIIFFSGNGLYFPNKEDVFREVVIKNNRYEWGNIAKNKLITKSYSLIIFVRDIYKQWYITGINYELNTQDKVVEKLKLLTNGYKVTTCGNSAGGYMAVLVGVKICAERIFSFSGQFFIDTSEDKGPLIEENINSEKNKYYNLVNLLDSSKSDIFYFYPGLSNQDIKQFEQVKKNSIYYYKFNESEHGISVEGEAYPFVLSIPNQKLKRIYYIYKDKYIEQKDFTKTLLKFYPISYKIEKVIKSIFSINNKDDHKIITMLGIKLKFKRGNDEQKHKNIHNR